MKAKLVLHKALLFCVFVLCSAGSGWAHAVVLPQRVDLNSFEKFILRVPTEKSISTTGVFLIFPENLRVLGFAAKPGWNYQTEKNSEGEIRSVLWAGGEVPAGEFIEFEFMARTSAQSGSLVWKVFQTYNDGSVVAWTGPPDARTPASITEVSRPKVFAAPIWAVWGGLVLSGVAIVLAILSLFRRG